MKKSISKYSLKLISMALLMSFLYTNLSLCEILITKCNSNFSSCCCKPSEKSNESKTTIEKKCCCELKEMTNQPAENNLYVINTGLKNFSINTVFSNDIIFNDLSCKITSFTKVHSAHSPPKKDLLILNSNFRI
ncbi:MAG TPA: hypothetical protein PKC91_12955 [Ignavibacteria bacterium]|nr:hypothetical protein [Ignavibacteria bacterium]